MFEAFPQIYARISNKQIEKNVRFEAFTAVTMKTKILKLPLGGLHVKQAEQRGIWVPTQHLLWDQGKPRKTCDYEECRLLGYRNPVRTSQETQ
jgi:hypothetical protein